MNNKRLEYLTNLAEEYEVDIEIVMMLAEVLGESEDHDGLVTSLEDYAEELHSGGANYSGFLS